MQPKHWKLGNISKPNFNDEVYDYLDSVLGNLYSQNEKAKDTRLIVREIMDNVARHGIANGTQSVSLQLTNIGTNTIEVKISHDGQNFDPFDTNSNCHFIKSIKSRLQIQTKMHLGDGAPRFNLNITVNIQ